MVTLTLPPLHITGVVVTIVACGVGSTVIVKFFVGPSHVTPALVKCGVTMIVATTGDVPALVAVNDGILPLPLAASPIVG
jgi:hypothetical protein